MATLAAAGLVARHLAVVVAGIRLGLAVRVGLVGLGCSDRSMADRVALGLVAAARSWGCRVREVVAGVFRRLVARGWVGYCHFRQTYRQCYTPMVRW